jgi:predicted acyltransferase
VTKAPTGLSFEGLPAHPAIQPIKLKNRLDSIDQFRGLAIILMVLVNYAADVQTVPAWFKHAPDIGLTIADLVAPMFIFAIGLTFGISARKRREREGLGKTIEHFVRRYLAILGIGAILSAGETMLGMNPSGIDWGALQAIGGAGLVTLLVIFLPTKLRFFLGVGLLAVYQVLVNAFWLDQILRSPHGGMIGTLSWAAILILATVLADLFHNESQRNYFYLACALTLMIGIALAFIVLVSKNRVSASYVLISLGVSGLVFSLFHLSRTNLSLLSAWGQNPILLYLLHYPLLALVVLPDIPTWHVQAPLWLAGLQALALVVILSWIALGWQKRKFVFSM